MAQATATLRYLRIAPRKVRSVAGLMRGLPVVEAEAQLMVQPRRAATPLLKLLRSAMANATIKELDRSKLYIESLRVDQGPMMKRLMARARGRGVIIQKKMSHVTIVLGERDKIPAARFVIPKKEAKKPLAESGGRKRSKRDSKKDVKRGVKIAPRPFDNPNVPHRSAGGGE
jgi:large subunit ribosomal protein L22